MQNFQDIVNMFLVERFNSKHTKVVKETGNKPEDMKQIGIYLV